MNKQTNKTALVAGAGGFIGGHLVSRLVNDGYRVYAVDIKPLAEWWQLHTGAQSYGDISYGGISYDLRREANVVEWMRHLPHRVDEVYNLAADMGGMGYIETHRIECMRSVLINTNLLEAAHRFYPECRYFFASSACVYPDYRQDSPAVTPLRESDAYPAMPENGYGWEKLFSERLCEHYWEERGLDTRVLRFHNVYGAFGTWKGGREKAPAALCRKVAECRLSGDDIIEIWGDGEQTRSFMHVNDCVEGAVRLMRSPVRPPHPLNLGSEELVTVNELLDEVLWVAGVGPDEAPTRFYDLTKPQGVRGRSSDNTLLRQALGWAPEVSLRKGLGWTYSWVEDEVRAVRARAWD